MNAQRSQQVFDDKDDSRTYNRRQKARDRMRRLRLDRKARIAGRRQLSAANLQPGERILELAWIGIEQTSIDIPPSEMHIKDGTLRQNEYKAEIKHEMQAIDEHGDVS